MAERLAALAVVAVTLLALGVTAAALSSPAPGSGTGGAAGTGSSDTRQVAPDSTAPESLPNPFPALSPWFVQLLAGAFAALSLATMLAYRGRTFLGGVTAFVAIGFSFLVIVVVAWAAGGPIPEPQNTSIANASMWAQGGGGEGGSGAGAASGQSSPLQLPGFAFGAIGLVLVAAVGALFYASSSVDETADDRGGAGSGGGDDGGSEDVGAAAARAADRLGDAEEADLANAVYEAWYEMATALDVDGPSTSTPGEFADAARDAGIDPAAVDDLTATFVAVRYGHDAPDDHEQRAVDALERIQAEHAVSSDEPGHGGGERG